MNDSGEFDKQNDFLLGQRVKWIYESNHKPNTVIQNLRLYWQWTPSVVRGIEIINHKVA